MKHSEHHGNYEIGIHLCVSDGDLVRVCILVSKTLPRWVVRASQSLIQPVLVRVILALDFHPYGNSYNFKTDEQYYKWDAHFLVYLGLSLWDLRRHKEKRKAGKQQCEQHVLQYWNRLTKHWYQDYHKLTPLITKGSLIVPNVNTHLELIDATHLKMYVSFRRHSFYVKPPSLLQCTLNFTGNAIICGNPRLGLEIFPRDFKRRFSKNPGPSSGACAAFAGCKLTSLFSQLVSRASNSI